MIHGAGLVESPAGERSHQGLDSPSLSSLRKKIPGFRMCRSERLRLSTILLFYSLFFFSLLSLYSCSAVEAQEESVPVSGCPPFPTSGVRSIFHPSYLFFSPDGKPDPVSIPPTRCGCGVKVLGRLDENFALRFQLLEAAQKSIWIETYIFTGDEIGYRTADLLIAKMKQGVDVRLIVDAYTKLNPRDQKLFLYLVRNGIYVRGFEPVYLLTTAEGRPLNIDDVNKRFHEKYWVLDGQLAILGGTNIANEYARYGDRPEKMWRDQDVVLTGPVVHDVENNFLQNYEYFTRRQEARLPGNQPWKWALARWKLTGKNPTVPPDPNRRPGLLPLGKMTDENCPVRLVRSRPRHHEDYVYQAYLHLFRYARKSLLIETAYFVPNKAMLETLIEAARRGVEVTIITNDDKTNDVAGMQPLSRYSYLPLIDAGITIYEWKGDHPGFGSMHAKCAVIDGEVAVIGSPNLDPRSLKLNSEVLALIDSKKATAFLDDFIHTVDIPVSEKISREQAAYWHDPKKIKDQFKLLFAMSIEEWY